MIKPFYLTHRWDANSYNHLVWEYLREIAEKEYYLFTKLQDWSPTIR